jgi:hypothetical protein
MYFVYWAWTFTQVPVVMQTLSPPVANLYYRFVFREMATGLWVLTIIVVITVILGIYRYFSGPDLGKYMAPPLPD